MSKYPPRQTGAFLAVFLIGSLLLSGCALPKGGAPICEYEELTRPEVTYPEMYAVIDDPAPRITWEYPESDCIPEYTVIEIYQAGREYTDYMHGFAYPRTRYVPAITSYSWEAGGEPGHSYTIWLYPHTEDDRTLWGGLAGAFAIGPLCGSGDALQAPSLLWFPDDWTIDPSPGFELEWVNNMSCWPEGNFVVQLSKTPTFIAPIELSRTPLEELWLPSGRVEALGIENCSRYYWRVRPELTSREDEPWSEVRSFNTHIPGTLCLENPFGPVFTELPPLSARILVEANCRSGPAMEFPVLSVLPVGNQYEIQAGNPSGDSWMVLDPAINNTCWVHGSLLEVVGDSSQVDILDPSLSPTETASPFNCAQYNTSSTDCNENQACTWDPNGSPNSPCVNK